MHVPVCVCFYVRVGVRVRHVCLSVCLSVCAFSVGYFACL